MAVLLLSVESVRLSSVLAPLMAPPPNPPPPVVEFVLMLANVAVSFVPSAAAPAAFQMPPPWLSAVLPMMSMGVTAVPVIVAVPVLRMPPPTKLETLLMTFEPFWMVRTAGSRFAMPAPACAVLAVTVTSLSTTFVPAPAMMIPPP